MVTFFLALLKFFSVFRQGLRDPEFRAMFVVLVGLLVGGTTFYASVEGWGIVDSVYFCAMTLATVGYGDLHPTTPISKIFTIVYLIVGAGVFVGFVTKLAGQRHNRSILTKEDRKKQAGADPLT